MKAIARCHHTHTGAVEMKTSCSAREDVGSQAAPSWLFEYKLFSALCEVVLIGMASPVA